MQNTHDTIVIGGGVIGLSIGWLLQRSGHDVAIVEKGDPGGGASAVAAGMLAPITEATFGEEDLLNLNLESAKRFPDFLSTLTAASSVNVDLETEGTMFCAQDNDRVSVIERIFAYQRDLGLDVQMLTSDEARTIEGSLHPGLRSAVLAKGDLAVDPRLLCEALTVAFSEAGGQLIQAEAKELARADGHVAGVIIDDAVHIYATHTILAAGCWSSQLGGLPEVLERAVRPVKGQTLRLRPPPGEPPIVSHIIRTDEVYLVPRSSGELVVGATVEEKGFDTSLTAGAVRGLLEAAEEIVPGVRDMEVVETGVGLRPGSRDNAPLLGIVEEGLIAATGHFRNGILLTPITALSITQLVTTGKTPGLIAPFSPLRFSTAVA